MSWYPGKFTRGTPVIPYGPGTSYATVNDLPDWAADAKLSILDKSTGIVSACCWVFHNDGTDYLNCGRPASLVALLNPFNDYIAESVASPSSVSSDFNVVTIADTTSSSTVQFAHRIMGTGSIRATIGGVSTSSVVGVAVSNSWYKTKSINNGGSVYLYVNDVVSATGSSGSVVSSGNLIIGSWLASASFNFQGDIAQVVFRSLSGEPVDCYDFTDPTKWNGGSTMVSCAGNTATFTDSAPTGIRKKAAIPRNLLAY